MIYVCCREERREGLRESQADLNGIDYLEVADADATPTGRQRLLVVHFVNDKHLGDLTVASFVIEGGERIAHVKVSGSEQRAGDPPNVVRLTVDRAGDFSTYVLRLVERHEAGAAPHFDPMLSSVEFSFKVDCPSEFDCRTPSECPAPPAQEPDLDYLAKDYASFRRLVLDRMALLMPAWKERNPADFRVALVEMLAYVGDELSYQQDAVATEPYLGLARRRVSVRRHARLVDYVMHDGCNARAWVHIQVAGDTVPVARGARLLTQLVGRAPRIPAADYEAVLKERPAVFEVMHHALMCQAHNAMRFYTADDERCCLPKGATRALLKDDPAGRLRLRPGDVLIFEEQIGPVTGTRSDADPAHRHAVRLTRVDPEASSETENEQEVSRTPGTLRTDPLTTQAIVEIEWDAEDALPFPFCISTDTGAEGGRRYIEDASVALGNIVLADHGRSVDFEEFATFESPKFRPSRAPGDMCDRTELVAVPLRFRPRLPWSPLTQAAPYDPAASATGAMEWDVTDALPSVGVQSSRDGATSVWTRRRDLLTSAADATHFVVETEHDDTAFLRFGNNHQGKGPDAGMVFTVSARVGNATEGNVAAAAVAHLVSDNPAITGVRNPLAARGGLEPESIESVRHRAPHAFRTQERAVTEEDYATLTERRADVQRAAATFRWTGSWRTAFVTVDRRGGSEVDQKFEASIRGHLERYRMAGGDLEVNSPEFVPLEIEMHVCIGSYYLRSHVREELLRIFSNRYLPDGRAGLFHPDKFTFGQTVYLSPLYAAAQSVEGVTSVHIPTFQRQGKQDPRPLEEGRLTLGRLEIARLDNDPNFPERGIFRLKLGGGR